MGAFVVGIVYVVKKKHKKKKRMLSNETYVLCFELIKVFLNKEQLNYVCFLPRLDRKGKAKVSVE